jgi:ABC-type transport system involved in cytochrome c biogenesis permease subunit
MSPFMVAMGLYVMVFVLACLSWLRLSGPLARAALWILGLTLLVHTLGIVSRIYIQGRPPVTNLYSSAIFVGWGGAVLGLILERLYRNGIGSVTAAGLGFVTLLVAHNLAMDGDTMTMMQAVLDTNFWLATHVVVITLGYGSTFLAGCLSIIYIIRGALTKGLEQAVATSLSRMIYGIIAFATLFSFVGTILGGIWADQSWGRFWGWDPKENGALLIVLWNALILHARWGGLARQRGIAVLGVAGNIVTSWSWFGTNMLGVGLHAYGFIDSALLWMGIFVGSQLAIIGIGLIPLRHWRSPAMRAMEKTVPPVGGQAQPKPA